MPVLRKKTPSVSSIVPQLQLNQPFTLQSVLDLFKKPTLGKYDLSLLQKHQKLKNNDHFVQLIKVLQQWNRRIDVKQHSSNMGVQTIKTRFIYNNLMRLVSVDSQTQISILQRIHKWSGIKKTHYLSIPQKTSRDDEESKVQMSFQSTLPQQLGQYMRKTFRPRVERSPDLIDSTTICNKNQRSYVKHKERLSHRDILKEMKQYQKAKSRLQYSINKQSKLLINSPSSKWNTTANTPRRQPITQKEKLQTRLRQLFNKRMQAQTQIYSNQAQLTDIIGNNLIKDDVKGRRKLRKTNRR